MSMVFKGCPQASHLGWIRVHDGYKVALAALRHGEVGDVRGQLVEPI